MLRIIVLSAALALSALAGAQNSAPAAPDSASSRPAEVKFILQATHPHATIERTTLESNGGRILATYGGAYAVALPQHAMDEFLQRLRGTFEVRELSDIIQTPGGRMIDPRNGRPALTGNAAALFLVQYVAPPTPDWQAALSATGAVTVESLPERAVVVLAAASQLQTLAQLPWVQYVGPYLTQDKFAPVGAGDGQFTIHVADTDVTQADIADIERRVGSFVARSRYANVLSARFRTDRATAEALVHHRFVLGVETYIPPRPSDERQALSLTGATSIWGGNYLNWLASHGISPTALTNSGIVIDIADTGVESGCAATSASTRTHADLRGRIVYHNGTAGGDSDPRYADNVGHGTTVAGIAAGNPVAGVDTAGQATTGFGARDSDAYGQFYYGMGVAPGARIGNTRMMNGGQTGSVSQWTTLAVTQRCNTPTDPCPAFPTGPLCRATVQNHSNNEYEATGTNAGYYTDSAREFDISVRNADRASMIPLAVTVSAGNIRQMSGDPTTTVLAPATAKNVISVGAVETFRESISACLNDTTQGDHPELRNLGGGYEVLAYASRRGTADNRLKPDVLAPATLSFGPHRYGEPFYCGTGGDPAQSWFPQYHGTSGTSFAAPVAAGSTALLRYRYTTAHGLTPTPAMYKAMLVAGARSIKGGYDRYSGTTINSWPNAQQGFGLMTLDKLFTAGLARDWRDQNRILLQSETAYYTLTVADPSQPVKVVLAWTDAPGAVQQPGTTPLKALKNDLDLRATIGTGTYYGNYFDSTNDYSRVPAWCGRPSCPVPADVRNNVEVLNINPSLFTDPANRSFTVRVVAPGLTAVGVPGASGGAYNQDYALFVLNGTLQNQ